MVLNAITAAAISGGPLIGTSGGTVGSRPSRSAAAENRLTGAAMRREMIQASGAAISSVPASISRDCRCHGSIVPPVVAATCHRPSGRRSAAVKPPMTRSERRLRIARLSSRTVWPFAGFETFELLLVIELRRPGDDHPNLLRSTPRRVASPARIFEVAHVLIGLRGGSPTETFNCGDGLRPEASASAISLSSWICGSGRRTRKTLTRLSAWAHRTAPSVTAKMRRKSGRPRRLRLSTEFALPGSLLGLCRLGVPCFVIHFATPMPFNGSILPPRVPSMLIVSPVFQLPPGGRVSTKNPETFQTHLNAIEMP